VLQFVLADTVRFTEELHTNCNVRNFVLPALYSNLVLILCSLCVIRLHDGHYMQRIFLLRIVVFPDHGQSTLQYVPTTCDCNNEIVSEKGQKMGSNLRSGKFNITLSFASA
jgi:hypothetical protein